MARIVATRHADVCLDRIGAPLTLLCVDPAGIPAMIDAIGHLHDCGAKGVETVHVHEVAPTGEVVWDGDVQVFDLIGHAKAKRAYAWSEATTGKKRRFFSALHLPPVESAVRTVRGFILVDSHRTAKNKH